MIKSSRGPTPHRPVPNFRVLCADWQAETYVECWTDTWDSAVEIVRSLDDCEVVIQIDRVVKQEGR